jgi:hypothetical protein
LEEDGVQEPASSSEDDEPERRGKSYNALLQMLSGPPEEKPARKKQKVRDGRSDEVQEDTEAFKEGSEDRTEPALGQNEKGAEADGTEDVDEAAESAEEDATEDIMDEVGLEEAGDDAEDGFNLLCRC